MTSKVDKALEDNKEINVIVLAAHYDSKYFEVAITKLHH